MLLPRERQGSPAAGRVMEALRSPDRAASCPDTASWGPHHPNPTQPQPTPGCTLPPAWPKSPLAPPPAQNRRTPPTSPLEAQSPSSRYLRRGYGKPERTHTHEHVGTRTYTNTFACLPNISYGATLREEVSVLIQMDIYRKIDKIDREIYL